MIKKNKKELVSVKQKKEKEAVLEQLKRIPVVQVSCEKVGISRATFYRWRDEDEEFRNAVEKAMAEGTAFLCDMSEAQMIQLIKEGYWPAVSFALRSLHPKYAAKLQIDGKVKTDEPLTEEQENLIKKAISLLALPPVTDDEKVDEQKEENKTEKENGER